MSFLVFLAFPELRVRPGVVQRPGQQVAVEVHLGLGHQLLQMAAEHLPEMGLVRTVSADGVLRYSVHHGRGDRLRNGPSDRHDPDAVDPACTGREAEERTADDRDSVRTGHRTGDGLRSHWGDNMDAEVQHGDIPDSRSEMAFPDVVACAVAYDELVAAEEEPDDGERLRSEGERGVLRRVADSTDREPMGPKSVAVGHDDAVVVVLVKRIPVGAQWEQLVVECQASVPERLALEPEGHGMVLKLTIK